MGDMSNLDSKVFIFTLDEQMCRREHGLRPRAPVHFEKDS